MVSKYFQTKSIQSQFSDKKFVDEENICLELVDNEITIM